MDNPKPEEFISIFADSIGRDGSSNDPNTNQPMSHYGMSEKPIEMSYRTNAENPGSSNKPKKPPLYGSKPPAAEITEDSDKETVKKMSGIESAKDRAQITSATAMSVVHIALLKTVLDMGSENDNYYSYRVGFILVALILQVIAGFIALYVSLLRSYYTKYRDDFLNDCFKICCPWRCRGSKKKQLRMAAYNASCSAMNLMDQECEDQSSCFPCECTTQSYYHFEYEILDMYDVVIEKAIRSEIDAARSVSEVEWFATRTESLKKKLDDYKNASDPESSAERLASINQEIKEAIEKKEELEKMRQVADSFLAQGIAMEKHVEKIYKQRVLKRVTFWQNLLNMVFYVVFILNAIIAGLGLADPNTQVANDAKTEAVTENIPMVTT